MLDWLLESLVVLINLIYELIINAFKFAFYLIFEFVYQVSMLFLEFLPDMNLGAYFDSDDISNLKSAVYVWNSFLPIEEVFQITFIFLGIIISLSVIKFLIKLIPTVG